MAEVVWSEPALSDLDAIADFIALESPQAAKLFVQKVFNHVSLLESHPDMGPIVPELTDLDYRQISEYPCRVFYRVAGKRVLIIHVLRSERMISLEKLEP